MAVETSTEKSEAGRLAGILAPVLTPFGQDLAPDARRLARHCRWLLAHGCAALAPFGTTSEANSLLVDEREALLDALVSDGVPAVRLMPGTGCCALPDSVRLTSHAVRRGCAGVLMLPPFYYKGGSISTPAQPRRTAWLVSRTLSGSAQQPVPGMSRTAGTPSDTSASRSASRSSTESEFASLVVPNGARDRKS